MLHDRSYCVSVFNTLRKICYTKNVVFSVSVVVSNTKSCIIRSKMIIFFIKELIMDSDSPHTAIIHFLKELSVNKDLNSNQNCVYAA